MQYDIKWLDPEGNFRYIEEMLKDLKTDTDLLVLPEMFTTGFVMQASAQCLTPENEIIEWMNIISLKYGCSVCGSVRLEEGGSLFNRFLYISSDGQIYRYDKRHLFRMAEEHRHYTAGFKRLVLKDGMYRINPYICYDLRFPVWCRNAELSEVQIFVANWPEKRNDQWQRLLAARAIENQCYVIGVNRVGLDGNNVLYKGSSGAYNWLGERITPVLNGEGILYVQLNRSELATFRKSFPAWQDADDFELKVNPD